MHGETIPVNGTIAPLRNVSLMAQLVERVAGRDSRLPGMGVLYGKSGLGKSTAAIYAVNKFRAYHVQMKSVWSRKKLCTAILGEMGVRPAGTISDMVDMIGEQLSLAKVEIEDGHGKRRRLQRPLIIDEADFLVKKGHIEIVRDIYEASLGTVILIGEEQIEQKLRPWERVHGRVLEWTRAFAASLGDTKHLAKLYCPALQLGDDLLAAVHDASGGSVRRICVNLDAIREFAETTGKTRIAFADWREASREFFTGKPPAGPR
jgi:DNA transposition AAA+ family ATPase